MTKYSDIYKEYAEGDVVPLTPFDEAYCLAAEGDYEGAAGVFDRAVKYASESLIGETNPKTLLALNYDITCFRRGAATFRAQDCESLA